MFCSKCGNQLDDGTKFCDKCGNAVGNVSAPTNNSKIVDDEVQLEVKPKFKFLYFMWEKLISVAVTLILFVFIGVIVGEVLGFLLAAIIIDLGILGISLISLLFKKKQLECMKYDFYKTKVNYSDSFLNKAEKEVKYKHIRECVHYRTVGDRIFKVGRIILYTNAETGFGNGIMIPCLENSEEVYRKIKELID